MKAAPPFRWPFSIGGWVDPPEAFGKPVETGWKMWHASLETMPMGTAHDTGTLQRSGTMPRPAEGGVGKANPNRWLARLSMRA